MKEPESLSKFLDKEFTQSDLDRMHPEYWESTWWRKLWCTLVWRYRVWLVRRRATRFYRGFLSWTDAERQHYIQEGEEPYRSAGFRRKLEWLNMIAGGRR